MLQCGLSGLSADEMIKKRMHFHILIKELCLSPSQRIFYRIYSGGPLRSIGPVRREPCSKGSRNILPQENFENWNLGNAILRILECYLYYNSRYFSEQYIIRSKIFKILFTKKTKRAQEVGGQLCLSAWPTRGPGGPFAPLVYILKYALLRAGAKRRARILIPPGGFNYTRVLWPNIAKSKVI